MSIKIRNEFFRLITIKISELQASGWKLNEYWKDRDGHYYAILSK